MRVQRTSLLRDARARARATRVLAGGVLWTWTLAGVAPAGWAQTLNLTAPRAPVMGDASAALALAAQIESEAQELRAHADEAAAVGAALRALAAGLLTHGQREAESDNRTASLRGSTRILLARSLVARLGAIEHAIQGGALPGPALAIMGADLARLASQSDGDLDAIERGLREALAPLTASMAGERAWAPSDDAPGIPTDPRLVPLGGWVSGVAPVDLPAYRTLVSSLGAEGTPLPSASVEVLEVVDELADRASADRAFRGSAESIRAAVLGASWPAGSSSLWPRWLGPTARATVDPAFERGLALLADPGRRAQGLSELRRQGRVAALVQRTDALADDQAGRRAREAFSNYLAAPPTNRELEAQLLTAYERALDLALAPERLPDERLLARPLRPAWREFQDAARVACDRLADALPTMLNDSSAMTDPGVLALFNGANQALAEARGLHALSALLTGETDVAPGAEPVVLDRYRDLASTLLTMAQVASRAGGSTSGEGAAAKRDLAALAFDVGAWRVLPGEPELRAAVATPDSAWTTATEGREHDLLDLVERTRAAYLENAISGGTLVERAALRARMALLVDLLVTVREVVVTQRMLDAAPSEGGSSPETPMAPSLNEWSGWELSRPAHRLLAEGLVDALSETVSLALRGEDERARLRIAAMRQSMAGALVPARLYLLWEGVRPAGVGALDDVGLGGPDARSWMPVPREALAEFCRVAEELPGIRVRRDDAQDRGIRAYLAALAQDALSQMR